MYNLLRFFVRYHLFFLFLLLESFCFYLIFKGGDYQRAAYINVANTFSGKVYDTYQSGVDYLYLKRYNDSLVAENAQLRARLEESKYDTRIDTGKVQDTLGRFVQSYTYVAARVIRNSVNRAANLIYIDRGTNAGITPQTGVIAPTGIVGQVVDVTDNYAAVMSVLNKDFKVSARLKMSEFFGNLRWDGINSNTATLQEIPKHVPVKEGDTVVTSGYSQMFPRNVMIGIVKKVKSYPDKTFLDVTVTLSTNFGNLSYVYVVQNLRKQETHTLDSLTNSSSND